MVEKYIPYTLRRQIGDWKAEWFYIDNHAPALLESTPRPPKQRHEWCVPAGNADQGKSFSSGLLGGEGRE